MKRQVLILDDEPDVRKVIRQQLSGTQFEVLEAEHAEQAMDLLRDYALFIDVIICDVRMPKLGGIEFLEAYREEGGEALILVMTEAGENSGWIEREVLQAQADQAGNTARRLRQVADVELRPV